MMRSQGLIDMPDWMPEQYQHPGHNFETWMDRLRFVAPALASAYGSDPEHTIRTRCQTNGIPAHLRATAPAAQEDDLRTRLSGPDLREKLEENSEASSKVKAEEQNNNNSKDPPLLQVPVAFA